jgi:hypothetical protein
VGEIVGDVEIEGEVAVDADLVGPARSGSLLEVPTERTSAVRSVDDVRARERDHVRAVTARIGHQRDDALGGDAEQTLRTRKVGVGHDDLAGAQPHQVTDPVVDRAIQAEIRSPDHLRAARFGPLANAWVVAGDEGGHLGDRSDHARGHPLGQPGAVVVGDDPLQPALRRSEPLHRDEHRDFHVHNVCVAAMERATGAEEVDRLRPQYRVAPMPTDEWTMVGVTGQQWRAEVAPWGGVRRARSDDELLDWYVAADDRWHVPRDEPTLRQRRVEGAPVFETRVRVPDGDAVQRAWAVADLDGAVVVEFENDSPLPIAVAVTGRRLATSRPPSEMPPRGIDLPSDAIVLPVGHHSTVRVAVAMGGPDVYDPTTLAPHDAVARGWRRLTEQASRLSLPDERLADAVVEARCDLLLEGPLDATLDPAGFLLDVAELVRMGEDAEAWLPELIPVAEVLARSADPDRGAAYAGLARVARAAGDLTALGDIERIRAGFSGHTAVEREPDSFASVQRGQSVGRFASDIESLLVDRGVILPAGLPTTWLGVNFEVHGLPSGDRSALGFAVRWHGDRPAVLWEQRGMPVELSAPALDDSWLTTEVSGEVLWPAPRPPRTLSVSADDSNSFS